MARIPVSDLLHRGLVFSLASLSVYGLFLGVMVHRETMEKGRRKSICLLFIPLPKVYDGA